MIGQLTLGFLKIFFRNRRAMFFVLLLPLLIFLFVNFLGFEQILRLELGIRYVDFLAIGIIAMAIMQTGIYTVTYNLVDYRRTQALKRLFLSSLTPIRFIWSQTLARFLIGLLQALLLLALAMAFFEVRLTFNVLWFPLLLFLGGMIFLNLGFIIASLSRDYEEAAPYTAVINLVLTFLGDIFFPVKNLPLYLQGIADFLPLKPFAILLRHSAFGSVGADVMLVQELVVLLIWAVVSTVAAKFIFEGVVNKR